MIALTLLLLGVIQPADLFVLQAERGEYKKSALELEGGVSLQGEEMTIHADKAIVQDATDCRLVGNVSAKLPHSTILSEAAIVNKDERFITFVSLLEPVTLEGSWGTLSSHELHVDLFAGDTFKIKSILAKGGVETRGIHGETLFAKEAQYVVSAEGEGATFICTSSRIPCYA